MTSPKDIRNAILGLGLARANSAAAPNAREPAVDLPRVASGAVGAVSRSLSHFDNQLKDAQRLASAGDRVVDLDADHIDPSFARDRMEEDEQAQAALVESLRSHGQQAPILVRPSPTIPGRFQIAYGHRRFRACVTLGFPVKAVIRAMDDTELLTAQGQENSARKDLSFIERAQFAAMLEDRGLPRDVAIAALSTDKTDISKLLTVIRAVPRDIVEAIGPAPKAGRTRWMGLADMLQAPHTVNRVRSLAKGAGFDRFPSDERFRRVFAEAAAKPKRASVDKDWVAPTGERPLRIERRGDATVLTVRETVAPEFARFLIDKLPELFAAFRSQKIT
jgi:ParB family transcriptional regulator, chromosome partitioning protein